jgi:hypothetical protein
MVGTEGDFWATLHVFGQTPIFRQSPPGGGGPVSPFPPGPSEPPRVVELPPPTHFRLVVQRGVIGGNPACPVGCRHTGQAALVLRYGVSANLLYGFERFILQSVQSDHVKVTFSGEGHVPHLLLACSSSHSGVMPAHERLATVH